MQIIYTIYIDRLHGDITQEDKGVRVNSSLSSRVVLHPLLCSFVVGADPLRKE